MASKFLLKRKKVENGISENGIYSILIFPSLFSSYFCTLGIWMPNHIKRSVHCRKNVLCKWNRFFTEVLPSNALHFKGMYTKVFIAVFLKESLNKKIIEMYILSTQDLSIFYINFIYVLASFMVWVLLTNKKRLIFK